MSLVPGEKYNAEIYDGVSWKEFVCRRDANMNIQTDMIETTTTGSGNNRTFKPTVTSATVGISGLTALNVAGFVTVPELHAYQFAKTVLQFRLTNTAVDLSVYIRTFRAFITNIVDTGSFDGVSSFQLSAQVTGKITQIYVQPPAPSGSDMRYPEQGNTAPATTGAYTWTATGLAGKYILGVFRDGRGSSDIITSGTPVGNEVLYQDNGADGDFTWPFPFEDGETPPYVIYRNQ